MSIWANSKIEFPDDNVPTRSAVTFHRYHIDKCPDKGNQRILDVGCGRCANLKYFVKNGLSGYGIDLSLEMINSYEPIPQCEVQQGNSTSLPYEDSSFDYGYSEGVFYYGDRNFFLTSLAELKRVTKRDGIIRIYTISPEHKHFKLSNVVTEPDGSKIAEVQSGWEAGAQVFAPSDALLKSILPGSGQIGSEAFDLSGSGNINVFYILTFRNIK